jgi:hypothetical protein
MVTLSHISHTFKRSHSPTPPNISGIPIALRVVNRDQFVRGPFHLGAFSYAVATLAVLWIAFISIVFVLPQANPVNKQTLNYAVVAVGIVVTYSIGFWVLSARKWFKGPIKQINGTMIVIDCLCWCLLIGTRSFSLEAEAFGVDVMVPGEADKVDVKED